MLSPETVSCIGRQTSSRADSRPQWSFSKSSRSGESQTPAARARKKRSGDRPAFYHDGSGTRGVGCGWGSSTMARSSPVLMTGWSSDIGQVIFTLNLTGPYILKKILFRVTFTFASCSTTTRHSSRARTGCIRDQEARWKGMCCWSRKQYIRS